MKIHEKMLQSNQSSLFIDHTIIFTYHTFIIANPRQTTFDFSVALLIKTLARYIQIFYAAKKRFPPIVLDAN